MKRPLCIWALFMVSFLSVHSEKSLEYPEPGHPCPAFVLRNVRYYPRSQARLEDFRGKWLVLDFWNKSCGACIVSFPKVSKLQQSFSGQVQFMMVGIQDPENQIEAMYAKYRVKKQLVMPCAFDSSLARRFDIYTAPYIIVIDPAGVVQAITYSLSAEDIEGFLSGHPPRLAKAYRMHEEEIDMTIPFDHGRPFLIGGNGGSDTAFLFRSVLALWDGFTQQTYIPATITADSGTGLFQVLGVPLNRLYNYAYYGTPNAGPGYHAEPVLETKDSALFRWSSARSTNIFSYSIKVPPAWADGPHLQALLQKDLAQYFGYQVTVETHQFPCWKRVGDTTAAVKLRTRGGERTFRQKVLHADFSLQNRSFDNFVMLLGYYSEHDIEDATGLSGNIDIEVSGFLDDPAVLRKSLRRYGLDLVPSERSLRVLVIKDKP